MKSPIFMKVIVPLFIIILCGCSKDLLDKQPTDQPSSSNFFGDETELTLAINGAYNGLWWESNRVPFQIWLETTTDISFNRGDYAGMNTIQLGQFGPETEVFNTVWRSLYQRIATCNNILSNMHRAESKVTPAFYKQIEAEAKFLRAWFYYYLINLYGDVPHVTSVLDISKAQMKKSPKAEIVDALFQDLDFAADILPVTWPTAFKGKVTKGAVLALKARLALSQGRYKVAADASKAVMDLKEYQLFGNYENLFRHAGTESKENILSLPYLNGVGTNGIPLYLGQRLLQGWSIAVPTQSLIDFYQCIDGKSIDESELYSSDKPFVNRDPRLTQSILTPGQWFGGYLYETHPDSTRTSRNVNGVITRVNNLESTHAFATFTGYLWKKYADPSDMPAKNTQSELNFMLMRYAEVLLTYAEAKIEMNEIDQSVLTALNEVRQRSSVLMPAVVSNDQIILRKFVRYERTVELAIEGHRLFDIRRWKYAEHVMPGNLLGRKKKAFYDNENVPTIDAYGKSHYANAENLFNTIGVNTFNPSKHYLWPIPLRELDLNKALTQNDGY